MNDTTPQTASGKVLWHFSMSLDGFVAGPNHAMDWLRDDLTNRPGLIDEYVTTAGAVLGGRAGWDMAVAVGARPYSDDWDGPIFMLTHHPEDATPAEGVTFLHCDPAEAVRIGLEAAGGKNLEREGRTLRRPCSRRRRGGGDGHGGVPRLWHGSGGGCVLDELIASADVVGDLSSGERQKLHPASSGGRSAGDLMLSPHWWGAGM